MENTTKEQAAEELFQIKKERYQSKTEGKKTYYSALVTTLENRADQLYKSADSMLKCIPMGQPIHGVRDRNFRDKMHDRFGSSFKMMDEAKKCAEKLENIGTGGISSNDPEAIKLLKVEIAELEEYLSESRKVNKALKKLLKSNNLTTENLQKELPDLSPEKIEKFVIRDPLDGYGIPQYRLNNRSANLKRLKLRLTGLIRENERQVEAFAATGKTTKEEKFGKVIKCENFGENRMQLIFPKPMSYNSHDLLRSCGFVFSRQNKAYQRMLNNAARYKAKYALEKLAEMEPHLFADEPSTPAE